MANTSLQTASENFNSIARVIAAEAVAGEPVSEAMVLLYRIRLDTLNAAAEANRAEIDRLIASVAS